MCKVSEKGNEVVNNIEAYMVGQVGIHDDHKVSRAEIEAVYVCGSIRRRAIVKVSRDNRPECQSEEGIPEAKLASARFKHDLVLTVGGSQLPGNLLSTIRAVVVDDDHLPGETTIHLRHTHTHTSAVPAHAGGAHLGSEKKPKKPMRRTFH
jgi:hypothetical protein